MLSLGRIIRRNEQVGAAATATLCEGRSRSWGEIAGRVRRAAAALRGLGVEDGARAAILALNSDRYLELYFAIPWAGGAFVPLNTRWARAELVHGINDSGARVLIVDDQFAPAAADMGDELTTVRELVYIGDGLAPAGRNGYEAMIADAAPVADSGRGGDDMAAIFYTGGTTGRSKGVMLSHRNLTLDALEAQADLCYSAADRFLLAAPLFHAAGSHFLLLAATLGASSVILPTFEPAAALAAIETHRATRTLLVPTMISMMVNHADMATRDISSMVSIQYGASPMPKAVIDKAMEAFPEATFIHIYGQTESCPALAFLPDQDHLAKGPPAGAPASVGRAFPGEELAILDDDDREVTRGTVGEICARGNVMLGYWNLPDETAAALRGGWLHTGDGGFMDDDGLVYLVDRKKDMIISGGENIYSVEVEDALSRHPAVAECAVIGIPHELWVEQVHAVVRLRDGAEATAAQLIEHCHGLIAGYKCPRGIDFRTEPLPLSGPGKVLKNRLREAYLARTSTT